MSEKVFLYGEIWSAIGRASIDDPDLLGGKFSSWQMLNGYNMGIEFRY